LIATTEVASLELENSGLFLQLPILQRGTVGHNAQRICPQKHGRMTKGIYKPLICPIALLEVAERKYLKISTRVSLFVDTLDLKIDQPPTTDDRCEDARKMSQDMFLRIYISTYSAKSARKASKQLSSSQQLNEHGK